MKELRLSPGLDATFFSDTRLFSNKTIITKIDTFLDIMQIWKFCQNVVIYLESHKSKSFFNTFWTTVKQLLKVAGVVNIKLGFMD